MSKRTALGLLALLSALMAVLLLTGVLSAAAPAIAAASAEAATPPQQEGVKLPAEARPLDRLPELTGGSGQVKHEAPEDNLYGDWQVAATNSPFGYARFDAEYSLVTHKVYVLGGRRVVGDVTDGSVWEFDPATGVYTDTMLDMPIPIANYHIARMVDNAGNEVFITFAGRALSGYTQAVQGFYPATRTFVTFDHDPFPLAVAPGGVEVVGDKAYVFGGYSGSMGMIDDTYIFDINASDGSRWTAGPDLGLARSFIATAVVDNVIYAIGGDVWDGVNLNPLALTERLDTTASPLAWNDEAVAELPISCDSNRAFGFDSASPYNLAGSIVVAGCGQWSSIPSALPDSFLYDVAANTWDVAFPDLNHMRRNHAGAFVPAGNGQNGNPGIWVWGGYEGADSNSLQIAEFYAVTPPFTLLPRNQVVTGGVGWTSVDVRGLNETGAAATFDMEYSIDPEWELSAPTSVAIGDMAAVTVTVQVSIPSAAACHGVGNVTITGTSQTDPEDTDTVQATVQSGGAWSEMPSTTPGGHWMASTCTDLVGDKGTCFYFGGLQGPGSAVVGNTRIYDIASGTWTNGATMPTAVFGAAAGAIQTQDGVRVYVAGGVTDNTFASVTGALQIYDPATDSWSSGPALPIARGGVTGGAVNGKLYVVGGMDPTYSYASLNEYSPATDQWYTRTSHITVAPGYYPVFFGSAVTSDKLYIGGDYFGSSYFLEYTPATDSWARKADLPAGAGQKSPVGAGVGTQIFWYGGNTDNWNNIKDTVYVWDPIRGQWALSPAGMQHASTGNGGGYAGGALWTFGGSQGASSLEPPPHESALPCVPAFPARGGLDGHVTDANTGLAIPNAFVYLELITDPNVTKETLTDAAGFYSFNALPSADTYSMYVSAKDYATALGYLIHPVTDTIITLNVPLSAPLTTIGSELLSARLLPGESVTKTLLITNSGTAPLLYTLDVLDGSQPLPPPLGEPLAAELHAKLDSQLLADLADSPSGSADFLVMLNGEADLSGAQDIADWNARGQYVYERLRSFAETSQAGLRRDLDLAHANYRPLYIVNGIIVESGRLELATELASRPDVVRVAANHRIAVERPSLAPVSSPSNASRFGSLFEPAAAGWNLAKVKAPDVWAMGYTGQNLVVAEIDMGTQWDHPALKTKYRGWNGISADHNYNWYDPYHQSPGGGTIPADANGHGTHVMGIMVGDDGGANKIGVAPGAKWISCKGGDNVSDFLLTNELLVCAEWILAPWDLNGANPDPGKRPHIVNNSWGGSAADYWYSPAIAAWRAAGIFPAFANGNAGPDCSTAHAPGDNWNSFASGATDASDNVAGFSGRGPSAVHGLVKPDISAPGVNIRSSIPGNGYISFDGTSMASPHTAGAVALLWSAAPELIGQIETTGWVLQQTAVKRYTTQGCGGDTSATLPNNTYGYGVLDVLAAVQKARAGDVAPAWVKVSPTGGVVERGQTAQVDVVLTALPGQVGHFTATLMLAGNDPYQRETRLPIDLTAGLLYYMPMLIVQ